MRARKATVFKNYSKIIINISSDGRKFYENVCAIRILRIYFSERIVHKIYSSNLRNTLNLYNKFYDYK